jgi:hypothetical protein
MDILTLASRYPRTSLTVALVPWKETDSMKERVKFVLEWEKRWNAGRGLLNFAELCREFGISRQVGYVWLRRYREAKHNLDDDATPSPSASDPSLDTTFCRCHRSPCDLVRGFQRALPHSGRQQVLSPHYH